MKKMYSLQIKGKRKSWGFPVELNPDDLPTYLEDGLELAEICNIIPEWAVNLGLTRPWCFIQDLFNFNNPWKK